MPAVRVEIAPQPLDGGHHRLDRHARRQRIGGHRVPADEARCPDRCPEAFEVRLEGIDSGDALGRHDEDVAGGTRLGPTQVEFAQARDGRGREAEIGHLAAHSGARQLAQMGAAFDDGGQQRQTLDAEFRAKLEGEQGAEAEADERDLGNAHHLTHETNGRAQIVTPDRQEIAPARCIDRIAAACGVVAQRRHARLREALGDPHQRAAASRRFALEAARQNHTATARRLVQPTRALADGHSSHRTRPLERNW